jgi:hypothetical protein
MKTLCFTKTLEMLKIHIITHKLHLLYFRENNISFTDNKCRIYHFVYACRWSFFTMGFCLCGAILNLKAFCFGAIPDIMIRVDSLWE